MQDHVPARFAEGDQRKICLPALAIGDDDARQSFPIACDVAIFGPRGEDHGLYDGSR